MGIEIIFEDDAILVINKPAGVAVQEVNDNDIQTIFSSYFVVHRLDQRVSGLLLLAKTKEVAAVLSEAFSTKKIKKTYVAVVKNKPTKFVEDLEHWHEKKGNKAIIHKTKNSNARLARLNYRLLRSSEKYHLVEIQLETGRFHQIRVQLAHIGLPIVGDLKYGYSRSSVDGSIFLHAYKLVFEHPITKEIKNIEIEFPAIWKKFGF
jgi:23S rRNA pseudouridine1911/1915/1917 synthase